MTNRDLPYFKKQIITGELIEELAEEGPKRPTEIRALRTYGSKQDRYGLLKELTNKNILKRHRISHKCVNYELFLDQATIIQIVAIKQKNLAFIEELAGKALPASNDPKAVKTIQEMLFADLHTTIEFLQIITSYSSQNPWARDILKIFLHKKIDGILAFVDYEQQLNPEATDKALLKIAQFLKKAAHPSPKNNAN